MVRDLVSRSPRAAELPFSGTLVSECAWEEHFAAPCPAASQIALGSQKTQSFGCGHSMIVHQIKRFIWGKLNQILRVPRRAKHIKMPTRSGKEYLIPWLCRACDEYYGHKQFGFRCSRCGGPDTTAQKAEELAARREALAGWLHQRCLNSSLPEGQALLRFLRERCTVQLFACLRVVRDSGRLLRARDALQLIDGQRGNVARGHVVASNVADWWNIKTSHAGGDWPSYLVCYYGDFDADRLPRALPPRPPHALLSCTETTTLHTLAGLAR